MPCPHLAIELRLEARRLAPRLAELLGVQPSEVEVLAITPAHAGRYAQQAALAASRAHA